MNEKHQSTPEPEKQPEAAEPYETEPKPSPAVYVASLADYNNGVLHGAWIDAAREPEAIQADINAMLKESREPGAEEFAIFDYDQFGLCRIHENDPIDLVARIARGIREHGYAFAVWADVHEANPERFDDFEEAYLGHYDSVEDYVNSPTTSATPPKSPSCPNRCSRTCASTALPSLATWNRPVTSTSHLTHKAAFGFSMGMPRFSTAIAAAISLPVYSGKAALGIHFYVVELSHTIEWIQQSDIQWKVKREIILMTPQQTVQLINLLATKRKETGLSVNEVARRAEVDVGTVWRIEQGRIPTPKAESLKAIGRVLGIPAIDLFAVVGWIPSGELPSIGPYLRAKYPQLPPEACEEIEAQFEAVSGRYGVHEMVDGLLQDQQAEPEDTLTYPAKG